MGGFKEPRLSLGRVGKTAPGGVGARPFKSGGIVGAASVDVCLLVWAAGLSRAPAFVMELQTFGLVHTEAGGLRSPRHLHAGRVQQDHGLLAPHPAGLRHLEIHCVEES